MARTSGTFFFNTRYDYDNAGRVTEIEHLRDDDVTPFSVYAFEYDLADRITYQTTTSAVGITALDGTVTEDFTFDNSGQLKTNDSSVLGADEAYTYDANGNRIGGDLDTGPYNRLEEDADWEYTYDKEGNLIRKDAKVGSAYTEYTYDHRNRLVTVKRYDPAFSNGVNNITYRYNADDQLVERYDRYLHGGSAPTFDARQYCVHSGSQRVLEFAEDGDLAHRATWGPGIDRLLSEDLYGANGQLLDSIWAATDHLGSVNHLLANNESIIEHRRYDSFGDIEAVYDELGQEVVLHQNTWDQTSLISDYAFAGRTWDLSADLYFNERRFYDPSTGRFINEDPAHDGSNWYVYAGNDPINNYDPTGLSIAKPTDNLYGGYGGGKISKAPPPVQLNPSLLSSPTVNYNSMSSAWGPVPKASSAENFNRYALQTSFDSLGADLLTPSYAAPRQLTSIRQIGGQSLGDMVLGHDLQFAKETVRHSTSMIESFNTQMALTASSWLKSALDVIGPASAPSYERRYNDGSRDFYLNGEPDTGALLNQTLALTPFLPKGPVRTSNGATSSANIQNANKQLNVLDPHFVPTNEARRNFGIAVHQEVPVGMQAKYPGTTFRFNVGPGQKGPDVHYVDGPYPGFDFADLKPRTQSGFESFQYQLQNWPSGDAGVFFYNPATGTIDFDNISVFR